MSAVVDELPRAPLEPGQVLAGRYRIEGTVGAGGMATVFSATHVQLEQRVAVKVLQPNALSAPGAIERFLREARTVARMKTEHVARVFDVGTLENGQPYAVMELLEGKDLSKIIEERGAMDVVETVSLLLQTCEALSEAHSLGIVHRDLKPENMFVTTGVDRRPFLKVIDFGLAKSLVPSKEGETPADALTKSFTVMGTPLYMSPEQLRDSRDVDLRTDIWSLGVVAYEMLTGRCPFDAPSLADLCVCVVRDPTPPITRHEIPAEIREAIYRCLMKEPADRYAKIGHFAAVLGDHGTDDDRAVLERVLRVQPLTSPPPRRPRSDPGLGRVTATEIAAPAVVASGEEPAEPKRWGKRRLLAIAAAGLAVGALVTTLVVSGKRESPEPTGIVGSVTTAGSATPAPSESASPAAPVASSSGTGAAATSAHAPAASAEAAPSPSALPGSPPSPNVGSAVPGSRTIRTNHPAAAPAPPPRPAKPTKDPLETR